MKTWKYSLSATLKNPYGIFLWMNWENLSHLSFTVENKMSKFFLLGLTPCKAEQPLRDIKPFGL